MSVGALKTVGGLLLLLVLSPITDHGSRPGWHLAMAARQLAAFAWACATLPWYCATWLVRRLRRVWRDDGLLRRALLGVDLGLIGFWIYSVAYIIHHPAAKGSDGFEIVLVVPMTLIALFGSLPALLLLIGRRTLRPGAYVTLVAIAFNGVVGTSVLWNSGLRHGAFWPLW